MIYVVNYADGQLFEKRRKINTLTARLFGRADKVIEYSSSDIDDEFKWKHKEIFSNNRGAGLWLWKPYLIDKALNELNYGDWLFYSDAGSFFINRIDKLINCANNHGSEIMLFELPLLNRQYTKREVYIKMGLEDHGERQLLGGFLLVKKTNRNVAFIREWLHLCEREDFLSPDRSYMEIKEWDDFIAHREDQSLLSMLNMLHHLKVFRDPSDYGRFPRQYSANGKRKYVPTLYPDSDYPTLLLLSRKVSPFKYFIKFISKWILFKVGLYNAI